jgi:hypothetical protein
MKRLLLVLLVLPLALLASPDKEKKQKKREWISGTITKAEVKSAGTFGYPMFWPVLYKTKYVWLYTIETNKITYELLWPFEMPLNVTINGPVQIAPGKNSTYYLIDDEERENRLMVFRKTAKPAPESPPGG